jgi:hypothetical protein
VFLNIFLQLHLPPIFSLLFIFYLYPIIGDRRQELVFIGQFGKDGGSSRKALEEVLDSCLLTQEEMKDYETIAPKGDDALRALFFPEK